MNRLFPLPIYTFLKIIYENGGVAGKGIKNLPSWMIKTILFEPLRWLELVLHNKRISRHIIKKDPVFILGFYRSGTSYLHTLLTKDDRLGYHSNFQMVFPEIMLSSEKWLSPFFEFIFRLFNIHDPVHRVPLSFRFPGEEDGAMTTSLNPRGAGWGYFFPKKMDKYFDKYVLFENITASELKAWKNEFVFLIKKISLANQGKQLVLKSPPNTARIKLILSLFPDAKFIFIHRNPFDVYASNKRFLKVTHNFYALGGTKSVDLNAVILRSYSKIMNRYLLEKECIPEGNLVEIPYQELIEQPLEGMRKIYETIHLNDFHYCENNMNRFIGNQISFVRLEHELPPGEKKAVADKLASIISHWNYPSYKSTTAHLM
jgi:hypothetical protein